MNFRFLVHSVCTVYRAQEKNNIRFYTVGSYIDGANNALSHSQAAILHAETTSGLSGRPSGV